MLASLKRNKNFPAPVDEKKSGKWKMENGKRREAGDTFSLRQIWVKNPPATKIVNQLDHTTVPGSAAATYTTLQSHHAVRYQQACRNIGVPAHCQKPPVEEFIQNISNPFIHDQSSQHTQSQHTPTSHNYTTTTLSSSSTTTTEIDCLCPWPTCTRLNKRPKWSFVLWWCKIWRRKRQLGPIEELPQFS